MDHVYLVAYDIRDPRRWRKVFRAMKGYGDSIQYSVFRCVLSPEQSVQMVSALGEAMNQKEDRILIADLGPVGGRGEHSITGLGEKLPDIVKGAIIL